MSEIIRSRELKISPGSLLTDNNSDTANLGIDAWHDAKELGFLTATHSCSDARVSMTAAFGDPGIISLRSIASAQIRRIGDPFWFVYSHPSTMRVIVLEHFDGESILPGHAPSGCGGLTEKRRTKKHVEVPNKIQTALDYVIAQIAHEDPVVQALISASKVARHTKVPVLAAAIDHRTYKLYPLAVFTGETMLSRIGLYDVLDYNPEKIYEEGIPALDLLGTSGPFTDLSRANLKQQHLLNSDPDFKQKQLIQNPSTVVISTEIRPAGIRYPAHFGTPNTAFIVRLPYCKGEGRAVQVVEKDLHEAVAQAGYALSHATKAKPDEAFYSTTNLLVETPDMGLTEELTSQMLRDPVFSEWRRAKNAQIIQAQVNCAKVTDIK